MTGGILSGPLDPAAPLKRGRVYPKVPAVAGLRLTHQATGTEGAVMRFAPPQLIMRDAAGRDHAYQLRAGAFEVDGELIEFVAPPKRAKAPTAPTFTASGSVDMGEVPARMARASRIYVEGIHDAELIEHVWGDDLRIEGIVVEPMDGLDDLEAIVRTFGPGPRRRLGILVDHLVAGSKESRIAATIDHPDVLICGHPYVDVWQGIKPVAAGIERWPDVPMNESWKQGILDRIGSAGTSGAYWKQLRNNVSSYRDLEAPLIGAVEELIDFVAPPE